MGTRNLTIVLKGREHKVALMLLPMGRISRRSEGSHGVQLVKGRIVIIEQSLSKCQWITDEQIEQRWREAHEACDIEFRGMEHGVSFDVSNAMKELYPHLQRDCGAMVLDCIINSADSIELQNQIEFAANDTFCEWIWIIDFDNRLFEHLSLLNGTNTMLWKTKKVI